MRNIKTTMLLLALSIIGFCVLSMANVAAQPLPTYILADDLKSGATKGLNQVGGGGASITSVASAVVNVLSIVVGIAAVIVVVVSGLKYITSGGDSAKVSSAKATLAYALIGLAIAALAQFLVHFVLNTTEGAQPCPSKPSITASNPQCK